MPVNFGRRRRCAKNRRTRHGAAFANKKIVSSKIPDKNSFYLQIFLMTFFSHRKLQQSKYTAKMASAARRQIIGSGGAPINKSWRRRQQIVGGGGAARPVHGSISVMKTNDNIRVPRVGYTHD